MFSSSEQETSSTYRELLAIHFALQAFQPLLKNCNVKLFTDSKMAARITEVGSMKFEYHQLAIGIFSTCLHTNIHLDLQWIPRTANEQADYLSRLKDFDDWEVAPSIFQQMDVLLGPHTLDAFANYKNAKVPRFFSRFWNPGTAGVDAFYQDWSNDVAGVVPPIPLVPRVLQFMFQNAFQGTLVVPHWPSAAYWPLLSNNFAHFITNAVVLKGNMALKQGTNLQSLLGSKKWQGDILACRVDFKRLNSS